MGVRDLDQLLFLPDVEFVDLKTFTHTRIQVHVDGDATRDAMIQSMLMQMPDEESNPSLYRLLKMSYGFSQIDDFVGADETADTMIHINMRLERIPEDQLNFNTDTSVLVQVVHFQNNNPTHLHGTSRAA